MKSIVILIDELYEDLELWYPSLRLQEEGYQVTIAGMQAGHVYSGKHGYPCKADRTISSIEEKEFHAIVVPGGFAPDKLRRYPKVLELLQQFHDHKKPIAFICHGGWVPISAKILKGKKATGTIAIKDDLINAGVIWEDKPVVIDHHLISSRTVADLPHFAKELIRQLKSS